MKFNKNFDNVSEKKPEQEEAKTTVYLDMDLLQPNKRNEYQMTEIEQLSAMIKLAGGILQNIIVSPANEVGHYTITTGERRWRAALLLRDKGEYPETLHNKVPCTIQNPQEIDLPLDDAGKEDFAILVTNQYRSKTDGEKYMEYQKWRNIIKQLRRSGVKYLPSGYDEEDTQIEIKGTSTRELVATQMGVSTGQISRYENIEKRGSEDLIERLMNDELNLSEAEKEIASSKKKNQRRKQEKRVTVNRDIVITELREIMSTVTDESIIMTEMQYKKYTDAIKQLKKLLI